MILPTSGTFYEVSNAQVIHMFNGMGHQPTLTVICYFKKSSLPCILSFLFGIILRCLTGRSFGLGKAKLEVNSVMARLYYGLNVDYASNLWEEFGTSISHMMLATGTTKFPTMATPRVSVDDVNVFPYVARVPNSMLKLVGPKNQLLVQYLTSIDFTNPTGDLPQKVVEETSKGSKAPKKKKQVEKKQVVDEQQFKEIIPMKTGVIK
ncbi:unnamed protein product [Lactuca saligna]|uniref:Uncharacterized protein n=1 Tax=Lactuca saligna TaxID=75948 RepID=A0AA35UVU5_LACSI|nr:unnamed protein product [Lactuca saligna]